jgi:hypothetical protein
MNRKDARMLQARHRIHGAGKVVQTARVREAAECDECHLAAAHEVRSEVHRARPIPRELADQLESLRKLFGPSRIGLHVFHLRPSMYGQDGRSMSRERSRT